MNSIERAIHQTLDAMSKAIGGARLQKVCLRISSPQLPSPLRIESTWNREGVIFTDVYDDNSGNSLEARLTNADGETMAATLRRYCKSKLSKCTEVEFEHVSEANRQDLFVQSSFCRVKIDSSLEEMKARFMDGRVQAFMLMVLDHTLSRLKERKGKEVRILFNDERVHWTICARWNGSKYIAYTNDLDFMAGGAPAVYERQEELASMKCRLASFLDRTYMRAQTLHARVFFDIHEPQMVGDSDSGQLKEYVAPDFPV